MTTQTAEEETVTWESLWANTRAFGEFLKGGGTLGALRGISERENEALYALGKQYYDRQRYSEAFKLFSMLVANDQMEPRYVMALGAAGQMIGRHEDALMQYMAASALMIGHPQPVFHSAQCLLELGHADAARETLALALSLCVEDEHAPVAGHIQQLIDRLSVDRS